jgi:hypothetical protein
MKPRGRCTWQGPDRRGASQGTPPRVPGRPRTHDGAEHLGAQDQPSALEADGRPRGLGPLGRSNSSDQPTCDRRAAPPGTGGRAHPTGRIGDSGGSGAPRPSRAPARKAHQPIQLGCLSRRSPAIRPVGFAVSCSRCSRRSWSRTRTRTACRAGWPPQAARSRWRRPGGPVWPPIGRWSCPAPCPRSACCRRSGR